MAAPLNLGILAHVDAGKTSLTERLLFVAGVLDDVGRVDHGTTQTDSLALERERGITIKAAVVSFRSHGLTINLIDTPGHPDFVAEVDRALSVLDAVVLVVSAVEGVQAQTRVLFRAVQRRRLPTLIFVNKVDRAGARVDVVLDELAHRLSTAVLPMNTVSGLGTRAAAVAPADPTEPRQRTRLLDTLTRHDDELTRAYVKQPASVSAERLRRELALQTRRAELHPVYFGSALTGVGVEGLLGGVRDLLADRDPDAEDGVREEGPPRATVFKVDRGPGGEKIAYARVFTGAVRVRDQFTLTGGRRGKVTGIRVFSDGATTVTPRLTAGQIGQLWGLEGVRIGDSLGAAAPGSSAVPGLFPTPSLETVVGPRRPSERGALYAALSVLADQDPLIRLRQDDARHEIAVSLYGEVQKEVIEATLARDFGLGVVFAETTTVCIERVRGVGAAVEWIDQPPNPFLATIGLRVQPGVPGAGTTFALEVELGAMPIAFFRAIEESVRATLAEGLHGWPVLDAAVVLTHTGYWPRQSHAHAVFDKTMSSTGRDFRQLTPLVLMSALREAGTVVCEPIDRCTLVIPRDTYRAVLTLLARLGGVPLGTDDAPGTATGRASDSLELTGLVPAASVHAFTQQLPGLTRGEAVLEAQLESHEPVRGPAPSRPRTDLDPLDRSDYLRNLDARGRA